MYRRIDHIVHYRELLKDELPQKVENNLASDYINQRDTLIHVIKKHKTFQYLQSMLREIKYMFTSQAPVQLCN